MGKTDKNTKNGAAKIALAKPKAVQQPAELSDEQFQAIEKRTQMVLAIGGFAAFGLLVGFLWGANHMVPTVHLTNALSQATKVACMVAVNTADFGRGLVMGVIGTVIGAAFGWSLFLTRRTA